MPREPTPLAVEGVEYPISDPVSCGENLAENARRAIEIAPSLCSSCADYHATFPLRRLAWRAGGVEVDRPELIEAVGSLVAERLRGKAGPTRVLVVGAADTGTLATCVHAAWAHAKDDLPQITFTVIDRCPTPLALCRGYGDRHAIAVSTACVDVVTTAQTFPADIVVTHSLFIQMPPDARQRLLRNIKTWLVPGGAMVSSERVRRPRRTGTAWLQETYQTIDRALADFTDAAGRQAMHDRLARDLKSAVGRNKQDFRSIDEFRALFTDAGLQVQSLRSVTRSTPLADGTQHVANRLVAVIAKPPDA